MYEPEDGGAVHVDRAQRPSSAHRGRDRSDGQGMVEFALIFPVFIFLILGGILLFMWELYNASAQFVVQEATYVAGYSSTGTSYTASAETQALVAIHESMLAAVNVSPHHVVMSCASAPKVAYKLFLCAKSTTSGNSTTVVVTVTGWMPSPTPIPIIGQLLPVHSQAEAVIQGFQ